LFLVCNQSRLVPSLPTMEPWQPVGLSVVGHWAWWDLSETERLEDNEFVFVSFWRHFNIVEYRHAYVEEGQGEGGQAGRENDA